MALEHGQRVVASLEAQPEEFTLAPEHGRLDRIGQRELAAHPGRVVRADLRHDLTPFQDALDHHFDPSAACLAPGEPRLDDARVIRHHDIARFDELDDVAEIPVSESARASVEMQQPARAALGRRKLSDQILRQRVVEIVEAHPGDYTFQLRDAVAASECLEDNFARSALTPAPLPSGEGRFEMRMMAQTSA